MLTRLLFLLHRCPPFAQLRELRLLRQRLQDELQFNKVCLAYLDQVEPELSHIRFCDRLYVVGTDTFKEVTAVGPLSHITSEPRDTDKFPELDA